MELSNTRDQIYELPRELSLKATLPYKWRNKHEEFGTGSFPAKGIMNTNSRSVKNSSITEKIEACRAKTTYSKKVIGIFSKGGR